jgi:hypothetical protein
MATTGPVGWFLAGALSRFFTKSPEFKSQSEKKNHSVDNGVQNIS